MNVAQASTPRLTIRDLRAVAVEVPMTYALGTSRGSIIKAPLLLIDLETDEGVTGRSYLFCYIRDAAPAITAILHEVLRATKGDRVAPIDLWSKLAQRFSHRRARHRSHGYGGIRCSVLGRAGDRGRITPCPAARRRAQAHCSL